MGGGTSLDKLKNKVKLRNVFFILRIDNTTTQKTRRQ
jgi:hypothetical protein